MIADLEGICACWKVELKDEAKKEARQTDMNSDDIGPDYLLNFEFIDPYSPLLFTVSVVDNSKNILVENQEIFFRNKK